MINSYSYNSPGSEAKSNIPAVLLMVCLYIFLVIERPWESIRYLEGIPLERTFAIVMIIVALAVGKFKIVRSPTNKWVYGLLALHFLLAPFAFNTTDAIDQGIEYAKMVVLYLLMLSVADDEETLKMLIKAYVFTMLFYMLHSLWEYNNGRHVWRMGITRMIGVDSTLNDPNAFGSSVVLSMPFAYVLLCLETSTRLQKLYYGYFGVAVLCVVLTGSRTASIALVFMFLLWALVQKGRKKIMILAITVLGLSALWVNMPQEKQERLRTLWNEDAGPANAHESAKGRMVGWNVSWELFRHNPLTGVGAGGNNFIKYRMAHNVDEVLGYKTSPSQSHILYGQVLAELGIFGAMLFTGLVLSILKTALIVRALVEVELRNESFAYMLGGAIIVSLLLLLVLGFGGHNFYRPLWLWLAAWVGVLYRFNKPEANVFLMR
jgi:O-antigen ligase